jgi:hypothetical protein
MQKHVILCPQIASNMFKFNDSLAHQLSNLLDRFHIVKNDCTWFFLQTNTSLNSKKTYTHNSCFLVAVFLSLKFVYSRIIFDPHTNNIQLVCLNLKQRVFSQEIVDHGAINRQ